MRKQGRHRAYIEITYRSGASVRFEIAPGSFEMRSDEPGQPLDFRWDDAWGWRSRSHYVCSDDIIAIVEHRRDMERIERPVQGTEGGVRD